MRNSVTFHWYCGLTAVWMLIADGVSDMKSHCMIIVWSEKWIPSSVVYFWLMMIISTISDNSLCVSSTLSTFTLLIWQQYGHPACRKRCFNNSQKFTYFYHLDLSWSNSKNTLLKKVRNSNSSSSCISITFYYKQTAGRIETQAVGRRPNFSFGFSFGTKIGSKLSFDVVSILVGCIVMSWDFGQNCEWFRC